MAKTRNILKDVELAMIYAEDGALWTAAGLLRKAADEMERRAALADAFTRLIELRALARTLLKTVPRMSATDGDRQQRRAALDAVGDALTAAGARIAERGDGTIIRLAGVRASATSGLEGAVTSWIAAAGRQLDKAGWLGERVDAR